MIAVHKWMLKKVKEINHERLDKMVEIMSLENHKSKLFIKFDMFWNIVTRGVGFTDYFRGNYLNLTRKEKDTFVTTKSFYKLICYLNDERYEVVLNDKILFNTIFNEYIKRDFMNLLDVSFEEFQKFLKNKKVVFAKDPIGYGGHGISKIYLKDYKDLHKLYESLLDKKQFLVEDEIVQCREINEINPNVVCSFRVVTLYKDGEVSIIGNALRINQDDTDIIGCTNDLYFSLDETGKISSNVIDDFGKIYEIHPFTKKKFSEVRIPGVKEAFDMCKKAALKLPKVRYIGWDIAFSQNGPIMVEGNEYPGYGILQFYKLNGKRTGHLKDIEDVLKEEMKKF